MVIIEDLKDSEEFLNKNKILRDARTLMNRAVAMGADEVEVYVMKGKSTSLDIENNRLSFASTEAYSGYGLRVIRDGRMGFAFGTSFKDMDSIIERALSLSRLNKKTSITFPDGNGVRESIPGTFDPDMLDIELSELRRMTNNMIKAARKEHDSITVTGGGIGMGVDYIGIVNTSGLEAADSLSAFSASLYCVMKDRTVSTGFEYQISPSIDFDPVDVAITAARLAKRSQKPRKLTKKAGDVVFTPHASSALLEFILAPALSGENAIRGASVYSGKVGKKVASTGINIRDDPTMPSTVNSSIFDDEGVASRNNVLIDHGVLKHYMYTLTSGAEAGTESTSNAIRAERLSNGRSYRATPRTYARNLIIESNSKLPSRKDKNALIEEVDRGVLCYDVMGAHTANATSGDFSVSSSTAFYIEKGEIKFPLKSIMLAGNLPDALKDVKGVARDFKQITGGLTPIGMVIPTFWVGSVNITSS